MTEYSNLKDQEARDAALDPSQSFIVQAPAGSGKTGLLTQRYLRLLACVESPEEIIAITFTRKAAAEMRERILQALSSAKSDEVPASNHARKTWELATHALQQDKRLGWNILLAPARLRIQTIDSLCLELARQMPLLSQFGTPPGIIEDARTLYMAAATATLEELESNDEWSDALALLLRHRDNRMDELQRLIAEMLGRRDQWLRHVVDLEHPNLQRRKIEAVLRHLIEQALARLSAHMPAVVGNELPALARFAASNLAAGQDVSAFIDLESMPGHSVDDLASWNALAGLLLTSNGTWRNPARGVSKAIGFPTEKDASTPELKETYRRMKCGMQDLLEALQGEEAFRQELAALALLPHARYSDKEWSIIEALFKVLLRSAQHLKLVFSQYGEVDFIEMGLRAKEALGSDDMPTDLTLRLDYQIRHLLVDEFQDTSQNQFDLFRRLTAGWETDDGRTLFLVGDPMQSIYRFREAEVGLFLDAWEGHLGDVHLQPLLLAVNFRSQQGVVDWVNNWFPKILPQRSDKVRSAVSYAPSYANKPLESGEAVIVHPFIGRDDTAEAVQVVEVVRQASNEYPNGTTAILVRGKRHLIEIMRHLKEEGISFQAVEIDRLAERPVIQDLLSLLRALLHLGDRISWLAVLRAPFCGLSLNDLHVITGDDRQAHGVTIIELLHDTPRIKQMSANGRQRLERVVPLLDAAFAERKRKPLREWVEGLWIALGGPASIIDDIDVDDIEVFFQLLEELDQAGDALGPEIIQRKAVELFALPDSKADGRLQIMTIHKAKGLEFDTVIIPGLGRKPRPDETRLLNWLEQTGELGYPELVFGPIKSVWERENRTADYIKHLEAEKGRFENGRLLYVAATRAKNKLYLLGHVDCHENKGIKPAEGSLLKPLWPAVEAEFRTKYEQAGCEKIELEQDAKFTSSGYRQRLVGDWSCPMPPQGILAPLRVEGLSEQPVEFDWAGESARSIGVVVHRLLQYLCASGSVQDDEVDIAAFEPLVRQMLTRNGVLPGQLDACVIQVIDALNNILLDKRGRWILFGAHRDAATELAVTSVVDGKVMHMVIDRTFIDEQGVRWIIDYKTSAHEGGDVHAFLEQEKERYRGQLKGYARVFEKMEPGVKICMGLYYPLLREWCQL